MNSIILVTGGARSGKSLFAEGLALDLLKMKDNEQIAYIAASVVTDDEFKERIALHKERRGDAFRTYEEPLDLYGTVERIYNDHSVFIIECMTTWLGNMFHTQGEEAEAEAKNQVDCIGRLFLKERHREAGEKNRNQGNGKNDKACIIITNEVGFGIVPENKLARQYRDVLGRLNQAAAAMAEQVFITISGIPMRIK
ncbi:bifunctional adenosylcobinamide kinase/adenosylcobinamide-phosphate guanylyltransferase [Spirochaetota bacterium]